jgi:hypothetical protein
MYIFCKAPCRNCYRYDFTRLGRRSAMTGICLRCRWGQQLQFPIPQPPRNLSCDAIPTAHADSNVHSHIGSAADLQIRNDWCPTEKRQGSAVTTQRTFTRTAPTNILRAINIAAMRCDTPAADYTATNNVIINN